MQKYFLFFLVIGSSIFVYFSYVSFVSQSMKDQGQLTPTNTELILDKQTQKIKQLNNDYRDIIERSKRDAQGAATQMDTQAIRQDYEQTMRDNRRQIEENRRQMEQMRRELQYR